jgi:hypothetical protein
MEELKVAKELSDLSCKNCIHSKVWDDALENCVECTLTQQISGDCQLPDDCTCGEGQWIIEVPRDGRTYNVPALKPEAIFNILNGCIDPWG